MAERSNFVIGVLVSILALGCGGSDDGDSNGGSVGGSAGVSGGAGSGGDGGGSGGAGGSAGSTGGAAGSGGGSAGNSGGSAGNSGGTAGAGGSGGGVIDPSDPPEAQCGNPTIHAEPGKVTLSDGTVLTQNGGQPITNPLAVAMNKAQPGDVIGVKGNLDGVTIGKQDPGKQFAVWWPNGQIVQNLCIVSENPAAPAVIRGISITGQVDVPGGHGVDELIFKNVILESPQGSATPLIVFQNSKQGMIRVYDSLFRAADPSAYGGFGMKWGARFHGRARADFRRCKFGSAEEHALYIDSPGWDGKGDSAFLDLEQTAPSGRTTIQIVNRANPAQGGGPTGLGNLYIKRIKARTTNAGGGSAITIAGHLGEVLIEDLDYQGNAGAVVFWSDAGKGLHKNANGFTCNRAVLRNIQVTAPNADRSHIAIAGVELVEIHDFDVVGNRTVIDLFNQFAGPVDNGTVTIHVPAPVSAYPGFKAGTKVAYKGKALTNAEIDALWAP